MGKPWGPRIGLSIAQVILRFTSVDVSIALAIPMFILREGKPNMKIFGKIMGPRLDVSLGRLILRFTSVDVSIALGIPMFIWRET